MNKNLALAAATALGLACSTLLGGCAAPLPPPQLYQLRAAPPEAVAAMAMPAGSVLQVVAVSLPEVLERDALLVPQGQAGLDALAGHRWAEPLRDAVPRLLRQDLASLLGEAQVWGVALPPGVAATRQLRVEVLALQARADRSGVMLQARWTLSDPSGRSAPQVQRTQIDAASTSTQPDALVAAHRLALWRLAQQIGAAVR